MPMLDTNVLLRWILNDVPEQTASAEKLLTSGTSCIVPDIALLETVYVLERVMRLSRATIAQSIETLLSVADLELDRALWLTALKSYFTHPKLSIADTYLAALAQKTNRLPLYTFDHKLANQLEPAELLR